MKIYIAYQALDSGFSETMDCSTVHLSEEAAVSWIFSEIERVFGITTTNKDDMSIWNFRIFEKELI